MFLTRKDREGMPSSCVRRPYKAFETIVDHILGDRVRTDSGCAVDLWCALANIQWHGPDGQVLTYSFRRAGELVAWVREEGDYMDWYCSGEPAVVADWISGTMADAGWSCTIVGSDNAEARDDT